MSRVFLASERALRRQVVIKVLAPELARGVSADRFRLEIQVAASLHHPHIVPLLAAGEAAGHLYYTMPFVAGESLRARLAREGELPVSAAVHVLADIARALAYAHRQGIVHRDIKPENVLLAEGEAQVADFGIAKALSASAQSGSLTSAGLALGTPVYMAPEQAMADLTADHRADLYALGVVGYEMLAGQPPFTGRSPQHLIAAHATETPVPVEQRRAGLPAGLARLIMRLLQKRPADRPQSADEVLAALEAVGTPAEGTATVAVRHQPARRGRWLAAGGVVAAALVLSLAWFGARPRHLSTDRQVVAIAPFRVTGADSSLSYLREGMVDLLATKLGGTSSLRPADPRTVLAAWGRTGRGAGELGEADAIRIAGEVGAGRLVEGEVVGSGHSLTVSARIIDVAGGATSAQATVEGPVDSLPRLVDRLAASLLALGAGEEEQRLEALTSTSLPALRAYLDGEALLRRGAFKDANRRFRDAQALDSTFALAGVGAMRAAEWYGEDDGACARRLGPPGSVVPPRPGVAGDDPGPPLPGAFEHGRLHQGRGAFRAARAGQPGRLVQAGRLSLAQRRASGSHRHLAPCLGGVQPLPLARLDLLAGDRALGRDRRGTGRFGRGPSRARIAHSLRLAVAHCPGAAVERGCHPERHGRDAEDSGERQHHPRSRTVVRHHRLARHCP